MIDVKGLTKFYGPLAAIQDVTFSVDQGEIIGFLGPNAAGKTTTMRILTGFSPPTRGRAIVAGFDISLDPLEVKRRVGYLPESVPLYNEMLVSKFLHYVAEVKGIPRARRRIEVDRVMERCNLTHMAKRLCRNLSKGYRQRVGLAQALIGNPSVLILDEPTVGLDPQQIIEIRQVIKELGEDHTVLLSTHILPEVTMVCERVLIINRGRVVAQDTMANLSKDGAGHYEIETDAAEPAVRVALEGLDGVKVTAVERGRYGISANGSGRAGRDLANEISRRIVGAGAGLYSLRARTRTLEDIFLEAISSDAADGTANGGAI